MEESKKFIDLYVKWNEEGKLKDNLLVLSMIVKSGCSDKQIARYYDSYFEHHKICHPRSVYIKLANLLKSMYISNRVMEIYETKKDIQHY